MTRLLYYENSYIKEFDAVVSKVIQESDETKIVLDRTAFYPGGGGQPCDTGVLVGENGRLNVMRTYIEKDVVYHVGDLSGEIKVGDSVKGIIDWDRRYRLMRMHTGAHILGYSVKKVFGLDVGFHGGALDVDKSHDDFNTKITRGDLSRLQEIIDDVIAKSIPVIVLWMDRKAAEDYIKKYGEKLTFLHEGIEKIRIVEIKDLYAVPCGGTHVKNTSEVKGLRLLKRESKGKGITRIRYTLVD